MGMDSRSRYRRSGKFCRHGNFAFILSTIVAATSVIFILFTAQDLFGQEIAKATKAASPGINAKDTEKSKRAARIRRQIKKQAPKGSAQEAINQGKQPYLGPGADRMSPQEYEKHYGDYIKEAIRVGFPPSKCKEGACEQSIQQLFRRSGLFDYPIPTQAEIKSWKQKTVECYTVGGTLAQVRRNQNRDLLNATVIFSKSPIVMPDLWRKCKEAPLRIVRAAKTGLEKIAGIPVGYPHPYLCASSQGLFVQSINFLPEKGECRAVSFRDNSWANGSDVDEQMCFATQKDIQYVWQNQLKPQEFVLRERKRQRRRMRSKAVAEGASRKEANFLMRKLYAGPMDHDFTHVGLAMRKLEVCNRYVVGGLKGFEEFQGSPLPSGGAGSGTSGGNKGSGGPGLGAE